MKIMVGFSSPSRDQVVKWVTEMGGVVLTPMQYKDTTHICFDGIDASSPEAHAWHRDNKRIISKAWIKHCYDDKMLCSDDEDLLKNGNTLDAQSQTCCSYGDGVNLVKRRLCFDEEDEFFRKNHQMFLCKEDMSLWTSLDKYAEQQKTRLVKKNVTPGSFKYHISASTDPQVKETVREVYILIKWLHESGFSLAGNFNSRNFIVDRVKRRTNVRFAVRREDLVKAAPASKDLDIKQLKKMIRREVFMGKLPPHDINLWMSLLSDKECEGLLPDHISLKDEVTSTELFMIWYDTLDNLERQRSNVYADIVDRLKAYRGWKKMIQDEAGNAFLEETLEYSVGDDLPVDYTDDAGRLLHLLRNCRQHAAKTHLESFIMIVAHLFPSLISDLQVEMFKHRLLRFPS